ncbi:hypothetical protein OV203_05565 [Nannocystis sp. ILAH1]|uniref:hypothetical protein n=1 Tax=Nannocystis sp. ILAH1 TaxID=2996789 RepID=UPI002271D4A7|nr:hypothetical protein [Nannocystis sp. ILAH1]MCY0986576.1 hypothetical protein [Nannocystis sp. ILAH1]
MTARQWQQPGGLSYWQASVPAQQLPTIQPFAELMRLRLTADELPWLADASYMRIVSHWRDFAPERELHRSSWALAVVVNEALGVDIVDVSRLASLDESGRTAELARIAAVIAAHRR